MDKTLSTRVKELCAERGISLKGLAERMGIKPESLSRALNGNPQLSTLENIAKALEVNVSDLFLGSWASDKPSPSDFIAVIIDHGQSSVYHSLNDLIGWVKENNVSRSQD